RQETRLGPPRGGPFAGERERTREQAGGRGDVAVGELGGTEKRGGLDTRERASALFGQRDGTAAVHERAGNIASQPQHLAQESMRPVERRESGRALLGQEPLQGRRGS